MSFFSGRVYFLVHIDGSPGYRKCLWFQLATVTSQASKYECLRAWAEPSSESLPFGGFMFVQWR